MEIAELCSGQLKLYSNVTETPVDWLWYPYIPFGKVTLLQGDPGNGKSALMTNIIASASTGGQIPDGRKLKKPMHVIYQCSEDGVGDTIKPRLLAAGADCSKVAFLEEEMDWLTLNDEKIRRAIADFNTKLLVIDPVQAYLGEADLSNASGMRKMLRQLANWAALYDCAIVLIGHLNKKQGSKDLYRALGSIDLVATARSVMEIDRSEDDDILMLRHIKSSLAPKASNQYFMIAPGRKIEWVEYNEASEEHVSPETTRNVKRISKQQIAAEYLNVILANGPMRVSLIHDHFADEDISERTILSTKKELGIQSIKRDNTWYWQLPGWNLEKD